MKVRALSHSMKMLVTTNPNLQPYTSLLFSVYSCMPLHVCRCICMYAQMCACGSVLKAPGWADICKPHVAVLYGINQLRKTCTFPLEDGGVRL